MTPRVVGLLLAAGAARRMGGPNKLLAPIGGRPMVARAAAALAEAGLAEVVVVLGHDADAVRAALAGVAARAVVNPDHTSGLASSIRAGIAALGADVEGVVVALGDMPLVRADTVRRLVLAAREGEEIGAAAPYHRGQRGNPVVWGRRHFPALLALTGDRGARDLLAALGDAVARVEADDDPGVLRDVDTPEDLAAIGFSASGAAPPPGDADLRALYQATIMRHARAPRGLGPLADATHRARGENPLCGDRVALALRCDGARVVAAGFEGAGCALSMASASLLADTVPGLTVADARATRARVLALIAGSAGDDPGAGSLGDLAALGSVRAFPARHRCATLAWDALDAALEGV